MEVRPIVVSELNTFLVKLPSFSGLFLQSPDWLKFQQSLGTQAESLGFWQHDKLIGTALALKRNLPLNNKYIYVPRGPLVLDSTYLSDVLSALAEYYQGSGSMFLRVEPPITVPRSSFLANGKPSINTRNQWLGTSGYIRTISIQPAATLLTDLSPNESELFKAMHPKTRYNVNLSLKKNLTWQLSGKEALAEFWQLINSTAARDNFKIHAFSHYKDLLECFGTQPLSNELAIRLALVKSGTTILAASLTIWYQGVVTYLHGASANEGRELMPTYLLHWRTMLEAKKLGYKFYDWWGINTNKHSAPGWKGITRFKTGWGGKEINYLGTFDYAYDKGWYWLYKLVRGAVRG